MATILNTSTSEHTQIEISHDEVVEALRPTIEAKLAEVGKTYPDFGEGEADQIVNIFRDVNGTEVHIDAATNPAHQINVTNTE